MGLLSEFRKWLDAEEDEAQAVASEAELKPRNKSEEFLIRVAREVEKTMLAEMFTPPGAPTYIPKEYIVYLSPADDDEWRGEKRRGLEQGLYHVLSERAGMIASEQQIQASSFAVDLKVDGTLPPGQVRVQAVWDTEAAKTMVMARKPATSASAAAPARPTSDDDDEAPAGALPQADPDATMVRPRSAAADDSEATLVQPRKALYTVSISRGGEPPERRSFSQPVVTIGRGARSVKVDLPLREDMEISRRQAVIKYEGGRFTLTCEGQNSIFVDGAELLQGNSVEVSPGQQVKIGQYTLELALPQSG